MIARLFALLLMVCGGGCRPVDAPDVAPYGPLEYAGLTRGTYVTLGEPCSNPTSAFRYDGTSVGWIRRGSAQPELHPIFRVREGPDEYVTRFLGDRPGMDGPDKPKETELSILSLGDGERIAVTGTKRIVMRICPEDALPVWARERPAFMQLRAGKAPVVLDTPSGGTLVQQGPCLGLVGHDGRFATAVWPATARIEFDERGLAVIEGKNGGRVRLGDYVQFTGGPLPKGVRYSFGDDLHVVGMPMDCARWPGYDGWIVIVNPGFRKGNGPAAASAAGLLPIATGAYAEQGEECGNPGALFRYDGRSMGWTRGDLRPMYPIRRVRKEHGQWVATIVAPGPGVAPVSREVDVLIVPRGSDRITVIAMERTEMKLCAPGELPATLR